MADEDELQAHLAYERLRAGPKAFSVATPSESPATPGTLSFPSGYTVDSRRHGLAILRADFSVLMAELAEVLENCHLVYDDFCRPGGNLSIPARKLHEAFDAKGWTETSFPRKVSVAAREVESRTHKADHFRAPPPGDWPRIAIEVEWNNKDPFFARDLSAFETLHSHGVISVGVIVTRGESLNSVIKLLGMDATGKPIRRKYGESTTHWNKLMAQVEMGGGGTCPLILIAIEKGRFDLDTLPKKP